MDSSLAGCVELPQNKAEWTEHNFTLESLMGYSEEDYNWTTTIVPRKRPTRIQMSWMLQLVWTILFGAMLLVAIGGNAIVMWIVLAHRRMRTVTNYFLVNLSLADLMMATFNCIFNFVYMLNNDWHFGRLYCTINNFIANVTVAASVFTLTGISFDRYLAIIRPLKPRMSKLSAHVTIMVIWMASLILGLPCIFYSTTITYKSNGQTACILVWPDGLPIVSTLDYVYNLILFLVTYVVPMTAMVGCYSAMGRELWGSRSIGELTQRQLDSIKSKRKVVRMFIIIVSIFGVCWLPYHSYFLYTYYHRELMYTQYVQHLYLTFYWLAMSNCMVNPLIYYWMNARFRQYFKTAVCDWHCTRNRELRSYTAETPPMIRHYSHSYSRSRSGTDDVTANERVKVMQRFDKLALHKHQNSCSCMCPKKTVRPCRHRETRDNPDRWQPKHEGDILFTSVEVRRTGTSQV